MFKQLLCTSAMAGAALALAVNYNDPSLYSGVNWDDPSLYKDVDFAYASTHARFFVLYSSPALLHQRIDPVMAPGQAVSQHAHAFAGANLVTPGVTSKDLQDHKGCSTFGPLADNSLWWSPSLWFRSTNNAGGEDIQARDLGNDTTTNNDVKFTLLPEKERKIYYMYPSNDTEEFPQDFRMIAGDPMCNSLDCAQGIVEWTCFSGSGEDRPTPGFPKGMTQCSGTKYTNGMMVLIRFPNCWNGNAFDVHNPNAHMKPSSGPDGSGECPKTHPRRLPAIKAEIYYDTRSFDGKYSASDNPWVLSFGDRLGTGFHMDMINGWRQGVLQNVMKTCTLGDASNDDTLTDPSCFGPGSMRSAEEKSSCLLKSTSDEDVGWNGAKDDGSGMGSQLSALPGCQGSFTGGPVTLKTCPAGSSEPVGSSAPADTSSATTAATSSTDSATITRSSFTTMATPSTSLSTTSATSTTASSSASHTDTSSPAETITSVTSNSAGAPIAALQTSDDDNDAGTVHVDEETNVCYTSSS